MSAVWQSGTLLISRCCFVSPRLRLPGAQLCSHGWDRDQTVEARGAGSATRLQPWKTGASDDGPMSVSESHRVVPEPLGFEFIRETALSLGLLVMVPFLFAGLGLSRAGVLLNYFQCSGPKLAMSWHKFPDLTPLGRCLWLCGIRHGSQIWMKDMELGCPL